MIIRNSRLLLAQSLILCLSLGCSGAKNPNAPANVSGEVTYKGTPLSGGTITFHSTSGDPHEYKGTIDDEGSYKITDIPVGEMTVTIETDSVKPGPTGPVPEMGHVRQQQPSPLGAGAGKTAIYVKIPEKYKNKNRSGLTRTLTSGGNKENFDLVD